ncbi:hypothetical protein [Mesorhizobium sp. SP-1A]|uniref:hypothetical protein n=1 Tax=Mesorhizobium sp. SP-1A TaxID=3077840 RepID=UPI0028F6F6FA|nr:hypothetical protein [Mesorhizobium sp. SP-1A]
MNEDDKQAILVSLQDVATALNSLMEDVAEGKIDAAAFARRRGRLTELLADVPADTLGAEDELIPLTKAQAIEKWGAEVVEMARDYYETDFHKYLFEEDIPEGDEDGFSACVEDVYERCERAARNLQAYSGPRP